MEQTSSDLEDLVHAEVARPGYRTAPPGGMLTPAAWAGVGVPRPEALGDALRARLPRRLRQVQGRGGLRPSMGAWRYWASSTWRNGLWSLRATPSWKREAQLACRRLEEKMESNGAWHTRAEHTTLASERVDHKPGHIEFREELMECMRLDRAGNLHANVPARMRLNTQMWERAAVLRMEQGFAVKRVSERPDTVPERMEVESRATPCSGGIARSWPDMNYMYLDLGDDAGHVRATDMQVSTALHAIWEICEAFQPHHRAALLDFE